MPAPLVQSNASSTTGGMPLWAGVTLALVVACSLCALLLSSLF